MGFGEEVGRCIHVCDGVGKVQETLGNGQIAPARGRVCEHGLMLQRRSRWKTWATLTATRGERQDFHILQELVTPRE